MPSALEDALTYAEQVAAGSKIDTQSTGGLADALSFAEEEQAKPLVPMVETPDNLRNWQHDFRKRRADNRIIEQMRKRTGVSREPPQPKRVPITTRQGNDGRQALEESAWLDARAQAAQMAAKEGRVPTTAEWSGFLFGEEQPRLRARDDDKARREWFDAYRTFAMDPKRVMLKDELAASETEFHDKLAWLSEVAQHTALDTGLTPDKVFGQLAANSGDAPFAVTPADKRAFQHAYDNWQKSAPLWQLAQQAAISADTLGLLRGPIEAIRPDERGKFLALLARAQKERVPDYSYAEKGGKALIRGAAGMLDKAQSASQIVTKMPVAGWFDLVAGQAQSADPIAGDSFIEQGLFGALEMLPPVAASIAAGGLGGAFAGVAGRSLLSTAFWWTQSVPEIHSDLLARGVRPDLAADLSAVGAVPYAMLETLQVEGFLPANLRPGADAIVAKTFREWLGKATLQVVKEAPREISEEGWQSLTTSATAQLAEWLDQNAPGVDWQKELEKAADQMRQAVPALLGLQLAGLGSGVVKQTEVAAGRAVRTHQWNKAKNYLLTPEGAVEFIRQAPDVARAIASATDPNGPSRKDLADVVKPTERWSKEERKQFADLVRQQLAALEKQNAGPVRSDQGVNAAAGPQPAGEPAGGGGNVQQAPAEGGGAHGPELRTESPGAPAQAPADVQQGEPTAPAPAELTSEETRVQVETVLARAPELKGATLRESGKKGELVLTLPGGRRAKVKLATAGELAAIRAAAPNAEAASLAEKIQQDPGWRGKPTATINGVEMPVPKDAADFLSDRFTEEQRNAWRSQFETPGTFQGRPTVDSDGTLIITDTIDPTQVGHEVVHWFHRNGLINDHEFNAVLDHTGFKGDRASKGAEEAFAYTYQDFRANRLVNPPSAVSEAFQRIADFLAALAGHAGARARQTMRTIESGKAATRSGVATQTSTTQAESAQPEVQGQPQPSPAALVPSAPTARPTVAAETVMRDDYVKSETAELEAKLQEATQKDQRVWMLKYKRELTKARNAARLRHRNFVVAALRAGRTVPSEVMVSYPDLAVKYLRTVAEHGWDAFGDSDAKVELLESGSDAEVEYASYVARVDEINDATEEAHRREVGGKSVYFTDINDQQTWESMLEGGIKISTEKGFSTRNGVVVTPEELEGLPFGLFKRNGIYGVDELFDSHIRGIGGLALEAENANVGTRELAGGKLDAYEWIQDFYARGLAGGARGGPDTQAAIENRNANREALAQLEDSIDNPAKIRTLVSELGPRLTRPMETGDAKKTGNRKRRTSPRVSEGTAHQAGEQAGPTGEGEVLPERQAAAQAAGVTEESPFVLRRIDGRDVKALRDPEELAPPFYLKSKNIINEKMPARADGAQVLNMLSKAGVKTEELFWTGLEKLLKQGKKVTKAEVLQHLDENAIRVEEVVKESWKNSPAEQAHLDYLAALSQKYDMTGNALRNVITAEERAKLEKLHQAYLEADRDRTVEIATQFQQYTLPGGTDYRELLLTMPSRATSEAEWDKEYAAGEQFYSSHFDEPNILAHVRFNERTDASGKRVLFIEEIQSDWHQKGRKEGYQGGFEKLTPAEITRYEALASGAPLSDAEYGEFQALHARRLQGDLVPDAPFKKTWPELSMKRMIRWAAENGFDRIAWTTGEQQAARYDLSKHIDSLTIKRRADDSGWNIAGKKGGVGVVGTDVKELADLDGVVGKDLADKARAHFARPGVSEYDGVVYSGVDLKIGGEGMKAFYDVQLPRVANDIGKKFGAKAGQTQIQVAKGQNRYRPRVYHGENHVYDALTDTYVSGPFPNPEAADHMAAELNTDEAAIGPKLETVHSLDIPPAMAESARSVGQPMFVLARRKFAQRPGMPSSAPPLINPTQQQAADQVRNWVSRTGKPVETTRLRDKAAIAIHKIVRHWADDQIAVKELRDEAMVGRSLALNADPYKLMQAFTFASTAMARDAIDHGVWSLVTGDRFGTESPVEAFKMLDSTGGLDADRIAQFTDFVAAQTALERMENSKDARGKIRYNPGIDPENAENSYLAAQSVVQQYANTPGFGEASRIFTTFHKNLVHMVAEVGRLSPESEKAIIDILPAYMPLMRVLAESVPGKTRGGKRGVANVPDPVKHQTKRGGPQQVFDPVAATMKMTEQFYMAATQTMVARAVVDTGIQAGSDLVQQVPAPTETIRLALQKLPQPVHVAGGHVPGPVGTDIQRIASELKDAGFQLDDAGLTALVSITRATQFYRGAEPVIVIFRNGQPEWYKLHPDLYTAVAGMEQPGLGFGLDGTLAGKAITGATKLKRLGATELRASFGLIINALRDFVTHPMRTEGFSPTAPIREFAAIVHQLTSFVGELSGRGKDPIVALFEQYGGELSGFIGQDAHSMYHTMRDVMRTAQGRQAQGIIMHPVDAIRAAFGFFEKSPRLAEFEMILKRLGYTRAMMRQGVIPPPMVVAEAMFGAQKVTTNFRRAGTVGRVLNKVSAYQNAAIQDVVDDWRLLRSHPLRTMVRGFMWLTLPSLLYWMRVKDEDWYRKLPAWRRLSGWNFRIGGNDMDGRTLTIPTPFNLGMVFAQLPIAIMDTMYAKRMERDDPNRVKEWIDQFLPGAGVPVDSVGGAAERVGQAALSYTPDVAGPALELLFNKSIFTGKPVISEELEDREPEDQYYDYTSSASKYFGWLCGISPAKLDYVIKGYTGGLGTDILNIPEQGVARALGYGRVLRNREETDSVNMFYAEQKKVNQAYNSALFHARTESDRPDEAAVGDEELVRKRYLMQQMATVMSDVRKLYREESDPVVLNEKTRLLTALADVGMGKQTLATFPSIFEAKELPYDVRKIRDKYIGLKLWQATGNPAPRRRGETSAEYTARSAERRHEQMLARGMLSAIGVSASEYRAILRSEAKRRGYNTTGPSFTARLRELRKAKE